jgi:hypothetical protein
MGMPVTCAAALLRKINTWRESCSQTYIPVGIKEYKP